MSSSNKDLRTVYDRSVARPARKSSENSKKTPVFKPHILGSPCLRKIYYSYNKVDEDFGFPSKNARVAELGLAIGKMLADAFYEEGIAIKYRNPDGSTPKGFDGEDDHEFRVSSEELQIKLGKIDLVCILDDGLWITEIKSINERGWKELKGPKSDHLFQGIVYLFLFNLLLKEGKFSHIPELAPFTKANGCRFLYYFKDKSELKEFVVTAADQVFTQVVTKIEEVRWYSQNDQLPPMTPDYCNSCPWRLKCAKNQKK